jgi:hypothetical protein
VGFGEGLWLGLLQCSIVAPVNHLLFTGDAPFLAAVQHGLGKVLAKKSGFGDA